jgi:transposase
LGVNEGTVRRDLKFLATPESKRPVKKPRPKKPKKVPPIKELNPAELRQRHMQEMLETVQYWIDDQGLFSPNIEYVLDEAGKKLHWDRELVNRLPNHPMVQLNCFR